MTELWRNNYGRRKGKALRSAQKSYMSNLQKYLPIGVDIDENPSRKKINIFSNSNPVWLEIGFGSGEHLFHQAMENPEVNIIGCEPYINGVATLLGKLETKNISNVLIYPGDVRDLMDVVPELTFERIFLLYPDPWPKSRHHKRRFVSPEFLDPLIPLLKPSGFIYIATDIGDYVRQAMQNLNIYDDLIWMCEGPQDWRKPWKGWFRTRYERKAIAAGRRSYYLTFQKR